jgi:DNA-directed RNA polymerase specialized sigma24 family protein
MILDMDNQPIKRKRRKKNKEHYINNAEFSEAVAAYVRKCKANPEADYPVTEEIGTYFLKLCNGLSHSPNFANYTYREDMVMDAVENCLKAIKNYDVDRPTRTGRPNPFSYFTQISYYAFLRRIAKEKKQQDIREKIITHGEIDSFVSTDSEDGNTGGVINRVINRMESDRKLSSTRAPKKYKARKQKESTSADITDLK